jgi:hypothetical protein
MSVFPRPRGPVPIQPDDQRSRGTSPLGGLVGVSPLTRLLEGSCLTLEPASGDSADPEGAKADDRLCAASRLVDHGHLTKRPRGDAMRSFAFANKRLAHPQPRRHH